MLYHLVGFVVLLILVVTACSGFHPSSLHRYQNTFPPRKGLLFHSTPTSTNEVVAEMDSTNGMFSCSNRSLYPPAIRQKNGTLEVDSIHTLYYEEYGKHNNTNEKGKKRRTGISLHGGPGAGSFPKHAQFFDPDEYERIILFDQRGCGRSTPRGEIKLNTLEHLVDDIEKLRIHLDIDKFDVVLGGSWGSTLALAYSQNFPERVGAMVLRGVCLFRPEEINWLFGNEEELISQEEDIDTNCISNVKELSDAWKGYKEFVANDGIDFDSTGTRSILAKYYNHLLGTDFIARAIATKSWFRWEMGVSSFKNISSFNRWEVDKVGDLILWDSSSKRWLSQIGQVNHQIIESLRRWPQRAPLLHASSSTSPRLVSDRELFYDAGNISMADAETFVPAQTMLTCYYSVNDEYMMSKFQLLSKENIDKIRHIPCVAVQGAKDLICPPDSALDLSQSWPEMECIIVTDGKHSMYDPLISSELIKATDRLAEGAKIQ